MKILRTASLGSNFTGSYKKTECMSSKIPVKKNSQISWRTSASENIIYTYRIASKYKLIHQNIPVWR